MIQVSNKKLCCGCSACAERCPRQCISMKEDEEGFLYPVVDETACVKCNVCDAVCPIINVNAPTQPVEVFAAVHKDEQIRKRSSSGGVFTALAEKTIRKGGVVFGARFDKNWRVVHTSTETKEGLTAFRGSKYVQSLIGNSFLQVEKYLKADKLVLFTGTPCQVAGLKRFLRKEYDNLLTVDVICHGVPSPLIWSRYVDTIRPKGVAGENSVSSLKEIPVITDILFRDKTAGWRKYGFSVWKGATEGSDENTVFPPKSSKKEIFEIQQENLYLRGFLQNLFLRPSCHHCRFRNFKSGSDMTIADFWGVEKVMPDFNDDKGMNLVILKNEKYKSLFKEMDLKIGIVSSSNYALAFKGNSSLFYDDKANPNRDDFFSQFIQNPESLCDLIERYTVYTDYIRKRTKLDHLLIKLGIYDVVKYLVLIIRRIKK